MLKLIKPTFQQLDFRQKLLADAKTMSFNDKWGGTVDFPREQWQAWYDYWLENPDKRFYRYLYSNEVDDFVGEVSYRFDEEIQSYICGIILMDTYRGKGYGKAGLTLLLQEAKEQGISKIGDTIALDNSSLTLFKDLGFEEQYRNEDYVMVEKSI